MARYRRSPGYCLYCQHRVWAIRRNHFFTKWRCEKCGTRVRAVGAGEVAYLETTLRDPWRAIRQSDGTPPDPAWNGTESTVYTGLINRLFGWLVPRP